MVNDKVQSRPPKPLDRFWIIGAGRFGRIAVERITRRFPHAAVTVVDRQATPFESKGVDVVKGDGIAWLDTMLDPGAPVDLIVPAIPQHVAAEWVKRRLLKKYHIDPIPIPDAWLALLPHAVRGNTGQVFASHADFICPDNCPEPENICSHTGQPRPIDLFRLLQRFDRTRLLPVVLRSHQLLPGVGGIIPADLIHAFDRACSHRQRPVMVATACRCHGVADFFSMTKKGDAGERIP